MEQVGHVIADRAPDGKEIRPDNAVGRRFSDWLKANHPKLCGTISYYQHKTPQWEGDARQYPNTMLPLYIDFVDTVWIPNHADEYFRSRDPAALPYLPRLLPAPAKFKKVNRADPVSGELGSRGCDACPSQG